MSDANQFSTFRVDGRFYGVNVKLVQEITKSMAVTKVPMAPNYIHGLINLRGQIATAIGIRELFALKESSEVIPVNVVCKCEGLLLSLVVDEIGDVLELDEKDFEDAPETIPSEVARFMTGVYKVQNDILSVIDVKKIVDFLNQ